jgi:hypothetical protein
MCFWVLGGKQERSQLTCMVWVKMAEKDMREFIDGNSNLKESPHRPYSEIKQERALGYLNQDRTAAALQGGDTRP